MMAHLVASLKRVLKAVRLDRLYYYLQSKLFFKKVVMAAEKDLASLTPIEEALERAGVELVRVTSEGIMPSATSEPTLVYPTTKRLKVAMIYLNRGYSGVAVVRGRNICGDIWYVGKTSQADGKIHPDLKWLQLECGEHDAYSFDMYLFPGQRGQNLANLLQNGALHEIRKAGYARAFGCYWTDNIPALWVHRTLKWKDLKRLTVTRMFGLYLSQES